MVDENPSKADITVVFKKLRSFASNKVCFDCGTNNPTWSSVTYGVFICIDCSAIHRGLGVHVSFVRSTQLDTKWTWLQLRAMQVGGNANATQFFRQHGCTSADSQQKYKSRAAQLYREKLHHLATSAMRMHGTKLHLEHNEQISPVGKDVDFFDEHTKPIELNDYEDDALFASHPAPTSNEQNGNHGGATNGNDTGPSVEHIMGTSPTNHVLSSEVKPNIGQRRPQQKKGGLGAKKGGGLGAQKVKADFSEIEKQAEDYEKQREIAAQTLFSSGLPSDTGNSKEDEVQQLSTRLKMQDMNEKRWKNDPNKTEQAERLGMAGFGSASAQSHSVGAQLKEIPQSGGSSGTTMSTNLDSSRRPYDKPEDDWEFLQPASGGGYGTNFASSRTNDDFFSNAVTTASSSGGDSWKTVKESPSWSNNTDDVRKSKKTDYGSSAASDEAQKKFGGAKAISSDQYFGGQSTDFETKTTLNRFEGQASISSADFFSDGKQPARNANYGSYGGSSVDYGDIKESVRSGVTKVAGKLSLLSSNVQSYIQDNYS